MPSVSELTAGDANRRAWDGLVTLIRDGRAILFAGAGFAVPAGYPTWLGLLRGLEDLCDALRAGFARDSQLIATDPLRYADAIKAYIESAHGNLDPYVAHLVRVCMPPPKL